MVRQLVLRAVEADLRERSRLDQRTHTEQPLAAADVDHATVTARSGFGNFQGSSESVGPKRVDGGNRCRLIDFSREAIVYDEVITRAIEFSLRFTRLRAWQQVARDVGPKTVEAVPRQPARGPAALGIGCEHDHA